MNEKQLIENILNVVRNEMKEYERKGFLYNAMSDVNSWNGAFEESFPYDMESFNDFLCGLEPLEIVKQVSPSKFNPNNDYFIMGIYGIESITEEELVEKLDYLDGDIVESFVDVLDSISWECYTTGKVRSLIERFLESEGE